MRAILMLEDGRSFLGQTDGAISARTGSVFFDTRVVGYQEAITDPANAGRVLVFTYPLIGNYGVAEKFNETPNAWPAAIIIKEKSGTFSNWQAEEGLDKWARRLKLPIVYGIDTRTLAVYLRNKGEMPGIVSSAIFTPRQLLKRIKESSNNPSCHNWFKKTSVKQITHLGKRDSGGVVVLDLGITQSIIRALEGLKLSIHLVPFNTEAEDILKLKPKALIISNGPEENAGLAAVASTVKRLLGEVPILGISTGAQVLALSLGAKIKRMRLGHHGLNYPIKPNDSLKGNITAQNHSYVTDANSLSKLKDIKITAYNLNDNSVEEYESRRLKALGVQYYPLSPGFGETHPVFKRFVKSWL
ncbi:MAG: carbamoyl phosphate synthase small subunit [Candidatus Omnitrophota bacterium]